MRSQKQELKKLQEIGRHSAEECASLESRYSDLQGEAIQSQDRHRQALSDLAAKEEELVCVKVELSAIHEKYKLHCNDVS